MLLVIIKVVCFELLKSVIIIILLDDISNYFLWVELCFKWKCFGVLGMLYEVNVLKFLELVLFMKLEISCGIIE